MFEFLTALGSYRADTTTDHGCWGSCLHPAADRTRRATDHGPVETCERCGQVLIRPDR